MLLLDSVENTAKTNKTKAALNKGLMLLETKIMDGDSCYQLLLAEVGSDKTASHDGALSVWKAIKALQDGSKITQDKLEEIKSLRDRAMVKSSRHG